MSQTHCTLGTCTDHPHHKTTSMGPNSSRISVSGNRKRERGNYGKYGTKVLYCETEKLRFILFFVIPIFQIPCFEIWALRRIVYKNTSTSVILGGENLWFYHIVMTIIETDTNSKTYIASWILRKFLKAVPPCIDKTDKSEFSDKNEKKWSIYRIWQSWIRFFLSIEMKIYNLC